jgi:hypothetical protein
MPNAVLSALGKGQDRTPTSQTPPKQNARSPLYFLHASKKSFFLLQDSTLFLYRKRVARHLQQLFWLGSHAQKFCFAGLSTILGRIPNVEKWLKKSAVATVVDAAKFFRAHLDGTGSSVNCPQRRTSCHEHLLNFFSPHAATGSRVLIPPLPICSAPQFLPSILP